MESYNLNFNETGDYADLSQKLLLKLIEIKNKEIDQKNIKFGRRYSIFPIRYPAEYEFYKKQESIHWSAHELEYLPDLECYENSSPQERKLIDMILTFFLVGDGVIINNIIFRFLMESETVEQTMMFIKQLSIEVTHAETYGLFAMTFLRTDEKINKMLEDAENDETVILKGRYMEKYMNSQDVKSKRYLAFACAEGIFFFSLFVPIFWFKHQKRYDNFVTANEFISRDETLHRCWGVLLYQNCPDKPSKQEAIDIVKEAVEIEDKFIDKMLPEPIADLNAYDTKQYVRMIADSIIYDITGEKYYGIEKTQCYWMDTMLKEEKTNFYELKVSHYQTYNVSEIMKNNMGSTDNTKYDDNDIVSFDF